MGSKAKHEDLENLNNLVSELTCETPKAEILKAQMARLGIEYSKDPAECMSRVLFLMQKMQFDHAQDLPDFDLTTIDLLTNKSAQSVAVPLKPKSKVRKDGVEI
jgi:hypothetical protein